MKNAKTDLKQRIQSLVTRTEAHYNELLKGKVDFLTWDKADNELAEEMAAIDKEAGPGLNVGRTLSFGVADGSAHYIITKIRKNDVVVEHMPLGDAYRSPAVGLSADRYHYVVLRSTAEHYCRAW